MEGGREKQSVSEKESGPKQLSRALAAGAAAKPVAWHGEAEGAAGTVAELGACPCCLPSLMLAFPLLSGGLQAGGGAPAPSSFSSCGALPLEPTFQRAATQMLPVELLNLESSRKDTNISRRDFFFFLGLGRSCWCHALLCSCNED